MKRPLNVLRTTLGAAGLLLSLGTPIAVAHHSGAMFDRNERLELEGTIKEFQFTNPHSWIQVEVPGENGSTTEWSLEWGSPNQLARQGIRPNTFPVGEKVS